MNRGASRSSSGYRVCERNELEGMDLKLRRKFQTLSFRLGGLAVIAYSDLVAIAGWVLAALAAGPRTANWPMTRRVSMPKGV